MSLHDTSETFGKCDIYSYLFQERIIQIVSGEHLCCFPGLCSGWKMVTRKVKQEKEIIIKATNTSSGKRENSFLSLFFYANRTTRIDESYEFVENNSGGVLRHTFLINMSHFIQCV